jgi:broad specificity phosphatase PhoE
MSSAAGREIVLVRHAETEWSLAGRHTGRTDVPLTDRGRRAARAIAPRLEGRDYELVLVSPLRRARETCELCGLAALAQVRDSLAEWDYGCYEGLTTAQVTAERPGWNLWRDGCPGGEDAARVGERVEPVIGELRGARGAVAVFAHGHVLRVLGARWIELPAAEGERLGLSTASLSALGYEHRRAILALWNDTGCGT